MSRATGRYGLAFWAAAAWLSALLAATITASWFWPHPNRFDPSDGLRGPSLSHPFGTTRLGEELLAQIVHGSRVALIVGIGAAVLALIIGAPFGIAAAYFGGRVDAIITTVLDAALAFPPIVLVSAVVLYRGQTLTNVVVVIGLLAAPALARVARSATASSMTRDYVTAARSAGAGAIRIIVFELAPNLAVPIATFVLLISGIAILVEGSLSFVGLGVPLDKISWGRLVAGGRDDLQNAWWWSMGPSTVIFLTILSINFVSDQIGRRWLFGSIHSRVLRRSLSAQVGERQTSSETLAPHSQAPARPSLLSVENVRVRIATPFGVLNAVDDVSMYIGRGVMLALVGESGAGKTMLARAILGIEPDGAAVDGRVLLEGIDLRSLRNDALRERRGRDIAVVFQDPTTSLDPVMKIGWQIAEPARVHRGLSRRAGRAHALSLMRAVGIAEPERRFRAYPHELSGGMRQRVAIALALSCDPKLLVADEPTSALDVTVQAQIVALLRRLRRERELGVLFITHDLALAAAYADEIAVMYAGRIVERGPAKTVFSHPQMPYTAALLVSAPTLHSRAHARLPVIPGNAAIPFENVQGCAFAPRCAYADTRCHAATPRLQSVQHGTSVACWHPLP